MIKISIINNYEETVKRVITKYGAMSTGLITGM